jgi:hypothetical protein
MNPNVSPNVATYKNVDPRSERGSRRHPTDNIPGTSLAGLKWLADGELEDKLLGNARAGKVSEIVSVHTSYSGHK